MTGTREGGAERLPGDGDGQTKWKRQVEVAGSNRQKGKEEGRARKKK